MKKIKQFLALLLIILSVAVYALYPKGANAHAEQNKITAGQDNNITAGKDKIATVQISNPSVAAASSVQNIACSDNGTPGTSTDDSVSFEVSTSFFSDYSITATFAGSSVPITLMDGTSATNLMGGVVQHFKIMNGALGTGNFTLTITPVTGTPETLTFANPGTCSTVCTSASTGNTVSYVYDSQYFRGDIQGEAFSLPKFDEGTNRKLTKVTVEYGSRVYGSSLLEHIGSGINEGKYRFQSKHYGDIAFLGFTNSNAGDIILQSPGYPALATIPAAVNVPAQGSWPGDVTSALGASTMSRMLISPDNTWLDNYLLRGVNPNTSPNWVTNITGNPAHDDDIVFLPVQSNAYIQPALTYTLQADLNKFIGTGAFNGTYDATTSMSSTGPINLSMAMINNLYAKVTYTYDCIAPPANFNCDSKMYLVQNPNTALYNIDSSTNPFTYPMIGSLAGYQYNAIGFNPTDNFIYGMKTFSNNLLRIDANGLITDLGAITGLPAIVSGVTTNYNSGEFDNLGNLYIKHVGSNSALYKVNVTTKTATLITLSQPTDPSDLAYNLVTGLLYGVNSDGRLFSINPANGLVSLIGTSPGAATFGGLFGSSTGEIYGINNAGGFYQFNLTTGERTLISSAPASTNNDGAHCVTAPIAFDADLSVTKTDNTATYTPGTNTVYTIIVKNNGPFGVVNASVTDNVPAGITAANVSYTAVASAGSSTSVTGTQTGAITDLVSLPVNGTVTYTVTVAIPASFTGNLVNTVTVTPPVNSTDPNMSNNTATDTNTSGACYNPAYKPGTGPDTKLGITLLKRAGAGNADNWPMVRKSGHIALESNTKGFVVTRIAKADLGNITSPQEGMMVYDTTDKCLKIYADGVWACFSNPACP